MPGHYTSVLIASVFAILLSAMSVSVSADTIQQSETLRRFELAKEGKQFSDIIRYGDAYIKSGGTDRAAWVHAVVGYSYARRTDRKQTDNDKALAIKNFEDSLKIERIPVVLRWLADEIMFTDQDRSIRLLREAVNAGDPSAVKVMVYRYETGLGASLDLAEAIRIIDSWLQRSDRNKKLDTDLHEARERIGKKLQRIAASQSDINVPALEARADNGDLGAAAELISVYESGAGNIQPSAARKKFWMSTFSAIKTKTAASYSELATAYKDGLGTEVNYTKAKQFAEMAVQSDSSKEYLLADIENKLGSTDRALQIYQKLCNAVKVDQRSCGLAAGIYGLRKDWTKARHYASKGGHGELLAAINEGQAEAQGAHSQQSTPQFGQAGNKVFACEFTCRVHTFGGQPPIKVRIYVNSPSEIDALSFARDSGTSKKACSVHGGAYYDNSDHICKESR